MESVNSTNRLAKADGDMPAARPMMELGVTGLKRRGGVIIDEPLRQLQGYRGRRIFREMASNDDVVGAVLTAIEMLVRQVEWREEPGEMSREAAADAEFLTEVRDDMSHTWEDFIAEVMSELVYGWSFHETVYKARNGPVRNQPGASSKFTDGKIGIRKMPIRAQESLVQWVFDPQGGVQGMVQRDPNRSLDPITIPIEKALLFRTSAHKGSPEGVSILRRSWRAWYFKKKIEEIEAIGIERDLAGLPVMWVPENVLRADTSADAALRNDFEAVLVNVRRDEQEGVLMPLSYDENGNELYRFELLSSAGTRQFNTNEIVVRKDRAIAGTMLADFILVGHESTGSFALHSDKTALFATALGSILDSIQAVLNRHLVPRLFALNGWQREVLPTWEHGDIEKVDLRVLSEVVRNLSQSGMLLFPDDNLEDHLRDLINFPARELEELAPEPEPTPQTESDEMLAAGEGLAEA